MRSKLFLFVLALTLPFACVEKRNLKTNQVIVHIKTDPVGLHPTNNSNGVNSFIEKYTQRKLSDVGLLSENVEMFLIEEIPTRDSTGTFFAFKLLNGIKWDNGQELLANDIVFTAKVILCPLTNNSDVRPTYRGIIDSIFADKKDEKIFYMKAKSKHVLNRDIFREITPLQEANWDPKGVLKNLTFKNINSQDFQSTPEMDEWFNQFNSSDNGYVPEKIVGLGPYQVTQYKKDNFIALEKKKTWWGDQHIGPYYDNNPDKIIFKIIQEDAPLYLGIKNEEIDYSKDISTAKLLKLRESEQFNSQYHSDFLFRYAYNYMGFNIKPDGSSHQEFFVDKKVRRAIAHVTPVEEIIEVIYYRKAVRQVGILPNFKASCDTSLQAIPYDIELAKQLLKESGWTDTDNNQIRDKVVNGKKIQFSFKLNYVPAGNTPDIVFMLKESFKLAGVELIPNPTDFNTLFQSAANHKYDAMLAGWLLDEGYSDPTQLWSTESWSEKGANFTGFGNSYSDSLIVKANTTLDPAEHIKAHRALQKLIYDEQPYVFLMSVQQPMVAHKRFEGTNFYRTRPNVSIGSFLLKTIP